MLSHTLHASFADTSEQRAKDRRVLRLEAHASTPNGAGGIQIHNLSRTGMLAESPTDIPSGTGIEVELPGGARHRAEVVWRDAELFGCRFTKPLSQATLSAALLRAAPLAVLAVEPRAVIANDRFAELRQHWDFEEGGVAIREPGVPLGKRMWVIIGLGLASWAIPTASLAWVIV